MTPPDMPAQWAQMAACKRCGIHGPYDVVDGGREHVTILELARMIEKHEQPPVDPDVLAVRGIIVAWHATEDGIDDVFFHVNADSFQAALAAFRRHKGGE